MNFGPAKLILVIYLTIPSSTPSAYSEQRTGDPRVSESSVGKKAERTRIRRKLTKYPRNERKARQGPPRNTGDIVYPPGSRTLAKNQRGMAGVPSGVSSCIKHLSNMASKDPLVAYEGHPEEIVNNGLMWNDPKSKCSVGSDESARKKLAEITNAWRMKDGVKVRALLQDLERIAK